MKTKQHKTIQKVSEWYSTKGFYQDLIDYEYEDMKKYFRGVSVLEIGPADGHYTQKLINDFEIVTCVEASRKYSNLLTKKFSDKATIINSFVEDMNHSKTYDTLILAHVLEHVPDPVKLLKKIKKYMTLSSSLIIVVPNAYSIHRMIAVQMGMLEHVKELNTLDKKLGHFRVYDQNDLLSNLHSAGYRVDVVSGVFLKVLSNTQLQKWDKKLLDGFYMVGKQFPLHCADLLMVCRKI